MKSWIQKTSLFLLLALPAFTGRLHSQHQLGLRAGVALNRVEYLRQKLWQQPDWQVYGTANYRLFKAWRLQPEIGLGSRHTQAFSRSPSHSIDYDYRVIQGELNLLASYRIGNKQTAAAPFFGLATSTTLGGFYRIHGHSIGAGSIDRSGSINGENGYFAYPRLSIGPVLGTNLVLSPAPRHKLQLDMRLGAFFLKSKNCTGCAPSEIRLGIGVAYLRDVRQEE